MTTSDKCALIILDGWGIGDDDSSNAIAAAHTPSWMNCCVNIQSHTPD